ncbi:MAG: AbrB/MazE/SpoVT family DNA-binding domain-containing protein [Terracidiphilus sp.]|jgi:AbrB family looped-hinge helix DNA binding protein
MEQVFTTVSSKGQMVIPAAIREALGIEAGTRIAIRIEGEELVLAPQTLAAKLSLLKELRGCMAGGPSMTDMLLEERRRDRERDFAKDGR